MNTLQTLTSNYIVNVGVVSWFSAQILKTLFTLIFTKKVVLERLVGAGGMPSSHSALTSSITIAMANKLGFDSPVFGLSLAFAAVVMYDAMGVRRAAGEQAKVLNRIVFEFTNFPFFTKQENIQQIEGQDVAFDETSAADSVDAIEKVETLPLLNKELKEFLGHTPLEVLGGCLLGILVAVFMPMV